MNKKTIYLETIKKQFIKIKEENRKKRILYNMPVLLTMEDKIVLIHNNIKIPLVFNEDSKDYKKFVMRMKKDIKDRNKYFST